MGCSILELDTGVTESGPAWRISGYLCNLDEGCLCVSGAASDLPGVLRFTRFSFFQQASLLLSLKWFKFCLSLLIFFWEVLHLYMITLRIFFFFQQSDTFLQILQCYTYYDAEAVWGLILCLFTVLFFSRFVNMVCHLSFSCHFGIVAFLLSII